MVILKRETGALDPRAQGNGGGHGKLKVVTDSIKRRLVEKPDLTLDDLVVELADRHGITIHRVSVWRFLRSLGLTHKKRPARRAIDAPLVRAQWRASRSGLMFARRAMSGSRDVNLLCATCCHALALSTKPR
jgi:transposase